MRMVYSVLAALSLCAPALAQRYHDLNGDGVADLLPPRTIVADFNRDGRLEMVRFEGRSLEFSSAPGHVDRVLTLDEPIAGIEARDANLDGLPELHVTLESGAIIHMRRDAERPHWSAPAHPSGSPAANGGTCDCGALEPTWNSGDQINYTYDLCIGDFDGDGLADILATDWPRAKLVVFENTGDGQFEKVFITREEDAPPGAFQAVAAGDTDLDGQVEILGGEFSSRAEIILYEAVGDNQYVKRNINVSEPDPFGQRRIIEVLIGDTDGDGRQEIIFATSTSLGGGARVFVYEHNGNIGENVYRKVYEYATVSYMVHISLGDSDNDGHMEIVLGFGGFGRCPIYLRRLENTGNDSWVHTIQEMGTVGLALSPTVADLDHDGENELMFGGVFSGGRGGGLIVFEAIGDDLYEDSFVQGGLSGTGLASTAGFLHCPDQLTAVVGSFMTEVQMWRFDGETYVHALDDPIHSSGENRSLAIGMLDGDSKPDLVFIATRSPTRLHIYEAIDLVGDFNGDGGVDLADFALLVMCLDGPNQPPAKTCPPDIDADLDCDGDVDLHDVGRFQLAFTGGNTQ